MSENVKLKIVLEVGDEEYGAYKEAEYEKFGEYSKALSGFAAGLDKEDIEEAQQFRQEVRGVVDAGFLKFATEIYGLDEGDFSHIADPKRREKSMKKFEEMYKVDIERQ